MRLLALDSASRACSAALLVDDEVQQRLSVLEREHGPELLRMIDELLAAAGLGLNDLDALVFGSGPGSFTGLRISAGLVQGIGFTASLPVIAVSTLAMLAQAAMDEVGVDAVAVCCDARMGEAFVGFYQRDEQGLAQALLPDALALPGAIRLPERHDHWYAVGDGWRSFAGLAADLGVSANPAETERLPEAKYALAIAQQEFSAGKAVPAEKALPVYLRESVAWRRDKA